MRCSDSYKPANYAFLNWKMIEPDSKGVIRWHIVNFTPDQPKEETIKAFSHAFEIWQDAFDKIKPIGRVLTFESTDDYDKADIRFFFMFPQAKYQTYKTSSGRNVRIQNPWPLDGPEGVLAQRLPNENFIIFDEGEKWSSVHQFDPWKKVGDRLQVKLLSVIMHELGHIFDLNHTNVAKQLMSPVYDPTIIEPQNDDMAGLQVKWGPTKELYARKLNTNGPARVIIPESMDYMVDAFSLYGRKEIDGPASDPVILEIIRTMFPNWEDDTTIAWCAVFANMILRRNGYRHTDSGMAKSLLKVGVPIQWEDRKFGDMIIYHRGSNPAQGHVNFYINDFDGRVWGLGGNQSNMINISPRSISSIAGIRRPIKT